MEGFSLRFPRTKARTLISSINMQELPESSRGDTFTESYFIVGRANKNKKSYKAEFILPHWGNKSQTKRNKQV